MVKKAGKKRKKVAKKRFKMTPRQRAYKTNRLMGMSQKNAAIAAGYSESYANKACKIETRESVKVSLSDHFDRAGATDQVIAQQLTQIALRGMRVQHCEVYLKREKPTSVGDPGKLVVIQDKNNFIEVPDERLRKDACDLITKLKKHQSTQPIIDQSEHTHLTVVVKEGDEDEQDPIFTNRETELSVQTTDES